MKRILLFIILLFGLIPVFENGNFKIAGVNTAYGQNADYHLMNYLQGQPGAANNYSYTVIPSGCNCTVRQVDLNTGGISFIYATPQYIASNPGFSQYINNQNGGNPSGGNNGDPEQDDDSEYELSELEQDMLDFEQHMMEMGDMMNNYWNSNNGGGNEGGGGQYYNPVFCSYSESYDYGDKEKIEQYNQQISGGTGLLCDKYLLKFKKIIQFTPDQKALIATYNFDGGTLVSITDINGKTYLNAQGVTITQSSAGCSDGSSWVSDPYISDRYSTYKFICFDRLRTDHPELYNPGLDVWMGVPYHDPTYCIEVPVSNVEDAAAGKIVVAPTSPAAGGILYCYTLTAEDAKLVTRVNRDDAFRLNGVNLNHYVNVPDWVKKFVEKIGLWPSDCVINYVNGKLAELHADADYINSSKAEQAVIEYLNLGYDMLFGTLYCWTDEAAASGEAGALQFGIGMVHEAVATLDVKEIGKALIKIGKGAANLAWQVAKNIVDAVKEVIEQQTNNGTVDWEEVGKKFITANTQIATDIYNKIKTVADHFKKTYFTECGNDPQYGDICSYRYGQVTMMAIPIVLTAGEWAVTKLPSLIGKYVSKTDDVVRLLDQAAIAGRPVTDVPYTLVDDLTTTTMQANKTIIAEGGAIKTTIKQEGRKGFEYIVITKADEFANQTIIDNLLTEVPTSGNFVNSTKFKNVAHKFDPEIDNFIKTKADDVIANGDLSGQLTEEIQNHLFETKMGLTKGDAKYGGGSDNGLDGLFIEGPITNPTKIYITECKQWNNGVQLNTATPTISAQLTNQWIQDVANNLRNYANTLPPGPVRTAKLAAADMLQDPFNFSKFQKIIVTVNKSTKDINLLKVQ
jgi:hypothetical protein